MKIARLILLTGIILTAIGFALRRSSKEAVPITTKTIAIQRSSPAPSSRERPTVITDPLASEQPDARNNAVTFPESESRNVLSGPITVSPIDSAEWKHSKNNNWDSKYFAVSDRTAESLAILEGKYVDIARNSSIKLMTEQGAYESSVSLIRIDIAKRFYNELKDILSEQELDDYLSLANFGAELRQKAIEEYKQEKIMADGSQLTMNEIFHGNEMATYANAGAYTPRMISAIRSNSRKLLEKVSEATLYQLVDERIIRLLQKSGYSFGDWEATAYVKSVSLHVSDRVWVNIQVQQDLLTIWLTANDRAKQAIAGGWKSFLSERDHVPGTVIDAFQYTPIGALFSEYNN